LEISRRDGVTVQVVYKWQLKIRAAARELLGST
jgi:hypothetical protein